MDDNLDHVTRYHMNRMQEQFKIGIGIAFIMGTIFGILAASFLHKYIVHPLGW